MISFECDYCGAKYTMDELENKTTDPVMYCWHRGLKNNWTIQRIFETANTTKQPCVDYEIIETVFNGRDDVWQNQAILIYCPECARLDVSW